MQMSKIKYRNKNGEIVDLPFLKGEDGQSAYSAAVEGGYSGTQEKFYADLASVEDSTPEALTNIEIEAILNNFV